MRRKKINGYSDLEKHLSALTQQLTISGIGLASRCIKNKATGCERKIGHYKTLSVPEVNAIIKDLVISHKELIMLATKLKNRLKNAGEMVSTSLIDRDYDGLVLDAKIAKTIYYQLKVVRHVIRNEYLFWQQKNVSKKAA